jgi:predicted transposase/invertase (TIGR01784 family)
MKFALTRQLYEKKFNKLQIANLYRFIDWLIGLTEPLEIEYLSELYEFEEGIKMSYVSFAERRGIKEGETRGEARGKTKGKLEGKFEVAKRLLKAKVSPTIIKKATGFSTKKIKELEEKRKRKH